MAVRTMFADKNGNTIIFETASGKNDITRIKNNLLSIMDFIAIYCNINYNKDIKF